ncbi:DUF1499 domain-containing protein [Marinovum sp.]|uniref:DUF1499 domain-containing protein n=1 Tax=Marinovum sp. TaxID=2024839 RepID=UPI003A8EB0FC
MKILFLVAVSVVLAGWAWVRFAPDDPARWHRGSGRTETGPQSGKNSHVYRERPDDAARRLAAFDAVIRATPRTTHLAGSLEERRITYVTRTRLVGYPDYTTLSLEETPEGPVIELFGRARYGRSDLGVNRGRIEAWIQALRQ